MLQTVPVPVVCGIVYHTSTAATSSVTIALWCMAGKTAAEWSIDVGAENIKFSLKVTHPLKSLIELAHLSAIVELLVLGVCSRLSWLPVSF